MAVSLIPGYSIEDNIFAGQLTPYKEPLRQMAMDNNMTDPQSETGFGPMVPQCKGQVLNPLLDMNNRPIHHFTHNNMVPHYKGTLKQNMYGTGVPQPGILDDCGPQRRFGGETPYKTMLDSFTGNDITYRKKVEVESLFKPHEVQHNEWAIGGMPDIRPPDSYYNQDFRIKNNELPFEQIRVGPGLGLDLRQAARTTGFQEMVRPMPDDTDHDHGIDSAAPVPGKWQMGDKPMARFTGYTLADKPINPMSLRPLLPTGSDIRGPSFAPMTNYDVLLDRPDSSQNRQKCNNQIANIHGPNKGWVHSGELLEVRRPAAFCGRLWNAGSSYYGKPSFRDETHIMKTPDKGFHNSLLGGVGSQHKRWNPNYPSFMPGVTRGETTLHSTRGNLQGSIRSYVNTDDKPGVTRAETTLHSTRGNLQGNIRSYVNTDDKPSVTRSETTLHSVSGMPSKGGAMFMDRSAWYGI